MGRDKLLGVLALMFMAYGFFRLMYTWHEARKETKSDSALGHVMFATVWVGGLWLMAWMVE